MKSTSSDAHLGASFLHQGDGVPDAVSDIVTTPLTPVTEASLSQDEIINPVFTTYNILHGLDSISDIYDIFEDSGQFLVVCPPWGEDRSISVFPTDSYEIDQTSNSRSITLGTALTSYSSSSEVKIIAEGAFTAFDGVSLAADDNSRDVIVKWQPISTSGGAILTTLKLAKYSIRTNEKDRRTVLFDLLAYATDEAVRQPFQETDQTISDQILDQALIGTAVVADSRRGSLDSIPSPPAIQSALGGAFSFAPTEEQWEAIEDRFIGLGIVSEGGDIQSDELETVISDRNLNTFIRKLT